MAGDHDGDAGGNGGGEVSLSIEETNKLRVSLGLAPLKLDNAKAPSAAEEEQKKRKRDEEDAARAAELEDKVKQARERRRQQELFDKTEKLGAAADDVDDVMAWVNKTRTMQGQQKQQQQKPKQRKSPAGDSAAAATAAGMKVKHSFDDLEEGEEVVLTLEDKPIIDDKGELIDEDDVALENVLNREMRQREKAYSNARKTAKPLWEEDGRQRTMLEKYDDDMQEDESVRLGDDGAIEAAKIKRQEDIRAKLAAAVAAEAASNAPPSAATGAGDYYTQEELEAMRGGSGKPKKKKKERRLKKKALTAEDLDALEAEAAAAAKAAAASGGDDDLGSRADRERRAAQRTTDFASEEAEKRSRFEAALAKANAASAALRDTDKAAGDAAGGEDEDEDAAFFASLNRAAELARKKKANGGGSGVGAEAIAEQLAKRREEEEKRALAKREEGMPLAGLGDGSGGGVLFSEIGEFARNIQVKDEAEDGAGSTRQHGDAAGAAAHSVVVEEHPVASAVVVKQEEEDVEPMDEDGPADDATADGGGGGWVAADDKATEATDGSRAKRNYRKRATVDEDSAVNVSVSASGGPATQSVAGEKAIGRGMAGALAFLKDRGELNRPVEWAGRTNDSRDSYFTNAMGGFKDVFTGGAEEDEIAKNVEVALTRKDEYGRILTPKEAWRRLCHDFHGNAPSKNTQEKRAKQLAKELAQKRKAATGAAEKDTLTGLKAVQKQASTPFVVLSGTVKPGQSREASRGGGNADTMPPPPPKRK